MRGQHTAGSSICISSLTGSPPSDAAAMQMRSLQQGGASGSCRWDAIRDAEIEPKAIIGWCLMVCSWWLFE